jgi:hypothetical protein
MHKEVVAVAAIVVLLAELALLWMGFVSGIARPSRYTSTSAV